MGKAASKHDTDFYEWTREQAEMLRSRNWDALDLEHLIEEVEDLGDYKLDAFEGALTRVVEHLLKLQFSPADEPRWGWRVSANTHRVNALRLLRRAKSLRKLADLAQVYEDARGLAADSLRERDGIDPSALPGGCPYTLDQILDRGWFPENPKFPGERA